MLINKSVVVSLCRSISPVVVVHVGAHRGEERGVYEELGAEEIHWVEVQPHLVKALAAELTPPRHFVYQAAAWSETGRKMTLHLTSNSQSSSLLPLKDHLRVHPSIYESGTLNVETSRLDEILPNRPFTVINLDIQGAELQALIGLGDRILGARLIYTEINRAELYDGLDQVEALDKWLEKKGFTRLISRWVKDAGWGDGIYVRDLPWHDRALAVVRHWSTVAKERFGGTYALALRKFKGRRLKILRNVRQFIKG